MQPPWNMSLKYRRDKYERDLKEYWVDTATTGTFENEHEESLVDRTSTEGIASSFDLGLPAAPDGIEDQGDESEAESTSGNEAPSVRSKVPKPDDLENEPSLRHSSKTRCDVWCIEYLSLILFTSPT